MDTGTLRDTTSSRFAYRAGSTFRISRRVRLISLLLALATPLVSYAEVCLDDDGFVTPCRPDSTKVTGYWSNPPSTIRAGVTGQFYITGGNTVAATSTFDVFANSQIICNMDQSSYQWGTTPVRHCSFSISTPGTYEIVAAARNGNFNAPYHTHILVVQP